MTQYDLAMAVFMTALCAWALQRRPAFPRAEPWVIPTPYGSEIGVRAYGRTDAEIIEHLMQTVG